MWWSVGSFCLAKYIGSDKNIEHLLGNASCHFAAHLCCPAPDLDQVCLLALHPAVTSGRTMACGYELAVIEDTLPTVSWFLTPAGGGDSSGLQMAA